MSSVDIPEREMWVYKIHNTDATLGEIIASTMVERAAFWVPPKDILIGSVKAKRATPQLWSGTYSGGKGNGKGKKGKHSGGNPPMLALTNAPAVRPVAKKQLKQLQNGAWLCEADNAGNCSTKSGKCKDGLHLCSVQMNGDRACGMKHPACNHNVRR